MQDHDKHFFWCTICGIVLFIPYNSIAMAFLALGSNSIYLALGYCGFSERLFLVKLSVFWLLGYPIILTISYFLAARKKHYITFLIVMLMDLLFVSISGILELFQKNYYGFSVMLPDILISLILCAIFSLSVIVYQRQKL